MEKKKQQQGKSASSSSQNQKSFGTNKLQISQDGVFHIVGSIVEKGISDEPQNKSFSPTPAPKPSVLPFPVARHRSHGPYWDPVDTYKRKCDDNDEEEDDDFDARLHAAFANAVERKEKKGLNFSNWKEQTLNNDSNVSRSVKTEKCRKDVIEIKNTSSGQSLVDWDVSVPMGMDVEDDSNKCLAVDNTKEAITSGSAIGMEIDESGRLHYLENAEDDSSNYAPINSQHAVERPSHDTYAEAHCEKMDAGIVGVLNERDKKSWAGTIVSSSRPNNIGNEQESMSLESEIDVENRARLQNMSPDEIAQAQAEIMDKMNPTLLNLLKKRGEKKLKQRKCSSSVSATNIVEPHNAVKESQKAIRDKLLGDNSPSQSDLYKVAQNLGKSGSFSWNAWSKRVEAIRELRFSLDGSVVSHDFVPKSVTGETSAQNRLSADNVGERDFLRTDGDPDAAGYTIKEAVSLSRSAIPGQRGLGLKLLHSVLDKALLNIHRNQVRHTVRYDNKVDKSTDWEAVWAYTLGPEPELVLSLRISLDDNHNSVVLECLKVVHCALSCDLNEYFFDISEKIGTCGKDIYTAPVFRSKPEIALGFLHGGYWKYSAKPSNILLFSKTMYDETDEEHTIQDDIVVAGQDFAAGLVRMGILHKLLYLLETCRTGSLEEDIVISIFIAIARHSPICANAILNCERLIETVVHRFTVNNIAEVLPSKIKSVCFLKVLARSDKKTCMEYIKNGTFQAMTWHLCRSFSSLEQWLKLGRENCVMSSGLMVEQLRFWRVCIQNGYGLSYFPDIFPALCLWLNPPSVEKLIENNVLREFASISTEAYLVLEALAMRLPNFNSQEHPMCSEMEIWSWTHVAPMLDSAVKWLALKSHLLMSEDSDRHERIRSQSVSQDLSVSPLLWVHSAIMHFLTRVLERVIPDDGITLRTSGQYLPLLPEFVPKLGLELIKNGFLSSLGANEREYGRLIAPGCSFIAELCHFRRQNEYEISLASVSCLHGLVRVIVSIDNLIQLGKSGVTYLASRGNSLSKEEKILEEGILEWSLVDLRWLMKIFVELFSSECRFVQSIEMFGRGGPAPGVGLGWGAPGGGFWSTSVLLAQTDAQLLIDLLEIIQMMPVSELSTNDEMNFASHIVNSAFGICLSAGPRDNVVVEKAFDILLHVPVLKSLNLFMRCFLQSEERMKLFGWEFKEEDYLHFSNTLTSHFKSRWLAIKRKSKAIGDSSSYGDRTSKKGSTSLDTIPEELDPSHSRGQDHCCSSWAVEWAHQKLPLPMHWFLSPIATISDGYHDRLQNIPKMMVPDPNMLEVAKAGLFFLLGIEATASFLSSKVLSPVQSVPLFWKLHSLSVSLLAGMGVLEEEKSKDIFEALQKHYGLLLHKAWSSRVAEHNLEKNASSLTETGKNCNVELLRFQSEVYESYSIFVETLVEQFAAISYGDLVYSRQVAVYLHRCVEAPVRLSAWKALSNVHALELLPSLDNCVAGAEGYLEPIEDNEEILEAYVKSWTACALDRAATRGSMAYTLVLHHLSSSIFLSNAGEKLTLRNKLVKSLLRDYSHQQRHERMMLDLIQYNKPSTAQMLVRNGGSLLPSNDVEKRFGILTEACEGSSSLLIMVEKLAKSS